MSENPVRDAIQDAIKDHEVILFMKGTPERPMCGFSARTAAALEALGTEYAAVDILPDPRIRQELSALTDWPTIPQVFVRGELIGGADITEELNATGELARKLDETLGADREQVVKVVAVEPDAASTTA
jgi:monothiol glutaredoxin